MGFRSNLGNSIKLAARDAGNEVKQDAEDSKQYLKDTWNTPLTKAKVAVGGLNLFSFLPGVKQGSQLIKNTVKNTTKETLKNAGKNTLKGAMAVETLSEPFIDSFQAGEQREYGAVNDIANLPEIKKALESGEITRDALVSYYNLNTDSAVKNRSAWGGPWYEKVGNAVTSALNTAGEVISYPSTLALDAGKFIGRVGNYMSDYNKGYINRLNQPITINRGGVDYVYQPGEPLGITQQSGEEYFQQKVTGPMAEKMKDYRKRFSL